MSRGRKPKNSGGNVVEMEPDTPDAEPIEPIEAQTPAPAEPEPEPARIEITPPETRAGQKRSISFFDRVRKITKADWGTRAFIYVYCLEPLCDLKMGGEKKYLVKLKEPIFDEDSIMIDYGSGKYRLNLVSRKPGATQNDQIDVCEIEIYNPKFPPKIPQSVWINDPRNERWAALIPKPEAPKPDTPMGSITETFKVFSDMRKDVRDELKPAADASTQKVDPVASALSMAKDLLQMRAENPMVDVMRDEMKAMRDEMKEEREENRKLQAELRQKAAPVAVAEAKDPIDTIVKTVEKLKPLLKEFMPQVEAVTDKVVNGRRPKWYEILLENAAPRIVDVLGALGTAAIARGSAAPPANGGYTAATPATAAAPGIAAPPAQPAAPGAPPPPANKLIQYLSQPIVMSACMAHFKAFQAETQAGEKSEAGEDFAYWIFTSGAGERPLTDARAMGTTNIVNLFRQTPAVWAVLQQHEASLIAFMDQVLSWKPEQAADVDEDEGVTDLTATM